MKPGTQLGPYEILEPLGKGGMGEVYRAHDPNLRRDVAIKVLPAELASDPDRLARLEREAHSLAALNHPNVATIHGLEEVRADDGTSSRFLVLELVDGETLAERLRAGPLEVEEALEIAVQIARGLESAHARGIIHRDLKPENVKITRDGLVKVLDFGLAKPSETVEGAEGEDGLTRSPTATVAGTETGVILGTAAYMSPEQARGKSVDRRTDIWAFGCVLYEMLTGRRAFAGETPSDTLAAILKERPDWEVLPAATPAPVRSLLRRCLRRDPTDRLRDCADARIEIEEVVRELMEPPEVEAPGERPAGRLPRGLRIAGILGVAAAAAAGVWLAWPGGETADGETDGDSAATLPEAAVADDVPSIAVLPLENTGSDDEDYFADGMTEALIADLAKIDGLKVISRTSVMQYRDVTTRILPEIARRLGVAYVVVGAVTPDTDRVRITAQLVDAEDRSIWSDSYERQLSDILSLQGDLARTIAGEIHARVTDDEARRLSTDRRIDPEAFDAYLRGRDLHHQAVDEPGPEFEALLQRALEHHRRAARLEPTWAQPRVGECEVLHWLASEVSDLTRAGDLYAQAKQACLRALERDDSLPEAHAALGFVLHRADWDWDGAAREYRRALELGGEDHWGYGLYLRSAGRLDESIDHFQRARERSPEFALLDSQFTRTLLCAGRTEEADVVARRLVARSDQPRYTALGHMYLAKSLTRVGRHEEALEQARAALAIDPDAAWILDDLGYIHAQAGDLQAAREIRDRLDLETGSWEVADLDVLLGHEDRVVDSIRRRFEQRSDDVLFMRCGLDTWDRLARLPEIQEIVEAVGFPVRR